MPFDPTSDFAELIDALETVTVVRPGSSSSTAVSRALRQPVRTREAAASAGRYTASDVVWHLPVAELPQRPRLGDVIVDAAGQRWTVLDVQQATHGSRWRCVARNLAIAHGLDQYVDIQQATFQKSDTGASEPTWRPWRTGVPARIQPQRLEVAGKHNRLTAVARVTVFLADRLALDLTHRIRGPDGTVYRILAVRQADRIDALMEVDVVPAE